MSCCGKSNNTNGALRALSANPRKQSTQGGGHGQTVTFEYVGDTALTAIGGVTRRRYQFAEPGARVAADPRDFHSLLQVPVLRQVR